MKRKWLVAVLCALAVFGCATFAAYAVGTPGNGENVAAGASKSVYVKSDGSDKTGDGSQDNPYASLARAVEVAEDGSTIYVLSNLTLTNSACFWGKSLTITSGENGPYTVTRGENVATVNDSARGDYNGAMLEVNGDNASLTLMDIVFDDAGRYEGQYFFQAESNNGGSTTVGKEQIANTKIVQDAIVATYNSTASIVLDNGAVLRNFGGMSAIRAAAGNVTMKSGALIEDTTVVDRVKGDVPQGADRAYLGPDAAVWLQGGNLVMEDGSKINNVVGRAIYMEGAKAEVSGTISNISNDADMRNSSNGIAVFEIITSDVDADGKVIARHPSSFTLSSSGRIEGIAKNDKVEEDRHSAVFALQSSFEAKEKSVITGVNDVKVLYTEDSDNHQYPITLNGVIENCINRDGSILYPRYGKIVLGATGVITGCSANASNYGLLFSTNGAIYELYGKITNNSAYSALYLVNHGGTRPVARIYEGAEISGNTNYGVIINNGSLCEMSGGKISSNGYAGVFVRNKSNTEFYMSGGSISDNDVYGIYLQSGDKNSYSKLSGGKVSGNEECDFYLFGTGAKTKPGEGCLEFASQEVICGARIKTLFGTIEIPDDFGYLASVGAAKTANKSKINDKLDEGWSILNGSLYLWFLPSDGVLRFSTPRPDSDKVLWAAYAPLNEEGLVSEEATVELVELDSQSGSALNINIAGLDSNTPYVFAFIESPDRIVRPLDLKKYITRDHAHDDGDLTNCFPDPRYKGIPANAAIKVAGKEWIPVEHNGVQYPFIINYYEQEEDGSEVLIKDDHEPGTYIARVEILPGLGIKPGDITINDERIVFEPGELQILEVTNATDIENIEDETTAVTDGVPNNSVAQAVAVVDDGIQWLVNGISKQYPNEGVDIRLLQDEVLSNEQDEDAYIQMMIKRVEREMSDKGLELDGPRQYAMKYLDFFDAHDSNVIVEPRLWYGQSYDLYIPYPSGTGQNTQFYLFDFLDLDRTYTAQDYGENAQTVIEECELVTYMNSDARAVSKSGKLEATGKGIKVTMERGSRLGAVALVWSQTEHTINASAGEGGIISPDGAVKVRDTSDKSFTVTANEGYSIQDVLVDGKSVVLDKMGRYTFQDVTEDHTIVASFRSNGGTGPAVTHHVIEASAGEGGSISPNGRVAVVHGSNKTFSFTADEGHAIDTVSVDGENVGAVPVYTFENVTDNHSIRVSFRNDDQSANPEDTGVSDLLQTLEHNLFLHGYPDGAFAPNQNMTRAEAAAMFYNLLKDKNVAITKNFSDIPAGAWYEKPVGVLATLGMIKGYEGTDLYGPENPITRAEFTTIAKRFTKKAARAANIFIDVYESDWYYGPVVGSIAYGWIHGYDDGTFRPNANITRAEVTAITNSMLGRRADKAYIDVASRQGKLKLFEDVKSDHWAHYDIVEATNSHDHTVSDGVESWIGLKPAK